MFFDSEKIGNELLPAGGNALLPGVREHLRHLKPAIRQRLSQLAARWDGYSFPPYGDSYREFASNRNRCNFENLYINRRQALVDLVMAAYCCGEDRGTEIRQLIRLIGEEETWVVPAHVSQARPEACVKDGMELYSVETADAFALCAFLMGEQLGKETRDYLEEKVRQRLFEPFRQSDAYAWMGNHGERVNNWNVWINSNVLFCAGVFVRDDEELRALVMRTCSLAEHYMVVAESNGYACDEGVRYWQLSGACVFDLCEMIFELTGGKINLFGEDALHQICNYPVALYDEYGHPANFADATIEFTPEWPLLIRMGERTDNPLLESLGRHLYDISALRGLHDNFFRQMKDLCTADTAEKGPAPAFPLALFLPVVDVLSFHKNDFFAVIKGGCNGESHSHNDLGSFIVYDGAVPVLIDPGVDLYSGYTFASDTRGKLWYINSDFHNTPIVNGRVQLFGRDRRAKVLAREPMKMVLELCGAYGLNESVTRSFDFSGEDIVVTDHADDASLTLNLMTPQKPEVQGNVLRFPCGTLAQWTGVKNILVECIDLTGDTLPPDGIAGDAPNRKPDKYSVLIPRLFVQQWKQNTLFRIRATVKSGEAVLKIGRAKKNDGIR